MAFGILVLGGLQVLDEADQIWQTGAEVTGDAELAAQQEIIVCQPLPTHHPRHFFIRRVLGRCSHL